MKILKILVTVGLLVGLFLWLSSGYTQVKNEIKVSASPTTSPTSTATPATQTQQTYTLAEIASHNTRSDCYLAISGKVYDVTAYVSSGMHPGGNRIIQGCGIDATGLFEGTTAMGYLHSQAARALVGKYYLGDLL